VKSTHVALALAMAVGCTGHIGDSNSPGYTLGAPSSSSEGGGGGGAPDASKESSCPTEGCGTVVPTDDGGDDTTSDSGTSSGSASAGGTCGASMDSYGYTRCACSTEATTLAGDTIAKCTGYDCCVRYGPDSGLTEGFGNPTLSSNLCACFSSADITAMLGAPATCQQFAGGGGATIASSCP
jgi:hypothetical protein